MPTMTRGVGEVPREKATGANPKSSGNVLRTPRGNGLLCKHWERTAIEKATPSSPEEGACTCRAAGVLATLSRWRPRVRVPSGAHPHSAAEARRFPKPEVAGSNPAGDTRLMP